MFKHLFVPVDGSELSQKAIDQSLALAQSLGARITGFVCEPALPVSVVNANPHTFVRQMEAFEARTEAHANKVLTHFAERAAAVGVSFDGEHVSTDATDSAIAEVADRVKADLIVMITHGRGVFGELLYGSHTKNVMSRTQVPLLVLH
ncbi:MAG: universal stress protein [Rubrivivax sp.]|jgi:nucleotide-binding universal stress UspA family protein|nr:universal stress protein [Rubrivivax sp.]